MFDCESVSVQVWECVCEWESERESALAPGERESVPIGRTTLKREATEKGRQKRKEEKRLKKNEEKYDRVNENMIEEIDKKSQKREEEMCAWCFFCVNLALSKRYKNFKFNSLILHTFSSILI